MKDYNSIRWERLEEIEVEFSYIKFVVKKLYKYQIRENGVSDFIKNIENYRDIDQCELLNILEEETYKKAAIFSIRQYKKNKEMPIIDDITNPVLKLLFKEKNDIHLNNDEYYDGELDSCFKVTYLHKSDNFVEIKMARIVDITVNENLDDGTENLFQMTLYDCCKFIIDINNKLVIMFFNDIKNNNTSSQEITTKKVAFRLLFNNVSSKNIIKYYINMYLEKYFKDYMEDKRNKNERKSISIIEAASVDDRDSEKSLIRSVKRDYTHNEKRLNAIENDIENEGLTISEIECCIGDSTIDLKMDGEISCINKFFYKEVIKNVCEEFFNGYKLS